jgi:hypothetical protein
MSKTSLQKNVADIMDADPRTGSDIVHLAVSIRDLSRELHGHLSVLEDEIYGRLRSVNPQKLGLPTRQQVAYRARKVSRHMGRVSASFESAGKEAVRLHNDFRTQFTKEETEAPTKEEINIEV